MKKLNTTQYLFIFYFIEIHRILLIQNFEGVQFSNCLRDVLKPNSIGLSKC